MTVTRKLNIYCLFILFALLPACLSSLAQLKELDAEKWANELDKKSYTTDKSYVKLSSFLMLTDSGSAFRVLNKLAEKGRSKGDYFQAKFNCLEARCIWFMNKKGNLAPLKDEVRQLLATAMDIAYKTEDEYLVAFVSSEYAEIIYEFGEIGPAVMYSMNSIDLAEKLSYALRPNDYQFLAEMLYRVREYNDCIKYAKKAAAAWKNSPNEDKSLTVNCINTIALGYHRQKMYDSAFTYYKQAFQLAEQINDTLWTGIVLGNMAQIYYAQERYDTAYTLLINDYKKSKSRGFYDNAGNSLQWAARANLARGNKTTALIEVREAFQLLKLWPDANYLRNTCYTATQIFREMGAYDSAFYYNNLYSAVNDSLERVVSASSLSISKARLNDETSHYHIQTLNKEKQSQLLLRNIIIAGIIVLSLFAVLVVNRNRLKTKMKMEKAEQEKLLMEQDFRSAKEQLEMFTHNIIEKTNLIEKLELQAKNKEASSERQAMISELGRQTILTEDDWIKFRSLFEKIYPGFFLKLKERAAEITIAEQRMAALTRLQLTSRQIASMLGISVDTVHKTRQRLRQRFQVNTEKDLEEILSRI